MINQLLNDHKINETEIFNLLSSMSGNGSDYSDLFFQHSIAESWVLEQDAYLEIKQDFHILMI